MLNKKQLEFIKASLTAPGAHVPCANNGEVARLFLETLAEIESQLKAIVEGD